MANFNLNKVILGGRITADLELKQTQSGIATIQFTIAVNRRFQGKQAEDNQTADFITIRAWRQTAEFVSRFFKKGRKKSADEKSDERVSCLFRETKKH